MRGRIAAFRRGELVKEQARVLAGTLDDALGTRALERRVSLAPKPRVAFRAAYLMDPADVGAFRAAFNEMRCQADVCFLLTGPWPPYSFVRNN